MKTSQPTEVILSYINNSIPNQNLLEPQWIRTRSPLGSKLYLESFGSYNQIDPTNTICSSQTDSDGFPSLLINEARRIGLSSASIVYSIPNINPRNNTLTVIISGISHTVVVPTDYYDDSSLLMDALVTQLNAIVGSGTVFSKQALGGLKFRLSSSPVTFRFVDTSSAVINKQTWNIPSNTFLNLSFTIGPIFRYYTKFIDFVSSALTSKTTKPHLSNVNIRSNRIGRLIITDPNGINLGQNDVNTNVVWTNYRFDNPITSVDVTLLDDKGNQLYIDNQEVSINNKKDVFWSIVCHLEY